MLLTNKIRVLIVDDSSVARAMLREILEEQEDIEVVAEATNGKEAIALVQALRPNLVTMDLNMPVMSGTEAIDCIMRHKAVPILVISSETDAELAYQALDHGALDVIIKPSFNLEEMQLLVDKVRLLSGVPVITRLQSCKLINPTVEANANALVLGSIVNSPVITGSVKGANAPIFAIAASTGGPQALAHLLSALPANFAAPIVIAQHISNGFIEGMAHWLSGLCRLPVKVAEDGELLVAGTIYLSPSEQHLTLTPDFQVKLKARVDSDIYHPSCDEMLASVAQVYGKNAVGIIMTGMGRDGVLGMTEIYKRQGITLAQDEASSVIYGMNGETVKAGVVHLELPLSQLANAMLKIVQLKPVTYLASLQQSCL